MVRRSAKSANIGGGGSGDDACRFIELLTNISELLRISGAARVLGTPPPVRKREKKKEKKKEINDLMQQMQYIAPNRMYVFGAVTQEPGPLPFEILPSRLLRVKMRASRCSSLNVKSDDNSRDIS